MKQKNKLISAIMIAGIAIASCAIAQNITGSGTNNYVLKFTSTGSTAGNSSIFDNGNVGIGTTTPAYTLDISKLSSADANNTVTNSALSVNQTFFVRQKLNNAGISGTTYPLQLMGDGGIGVMEIYTQGADALVFGTNATEQMRILSGGNVGIGTTTPLAKLHLNNGSVLFDGTTGSTPTSGAGTRAMWIPAKGAFRAGAVTGSTWDDANIGTSSVAFGADTKASGDYSTALGGGTIASANSSLASGAFTSATGLASFAAGLSSTASGDYSTTFGNTTTASGGNSVALGTNTTAQPYSSFVIGRYNTISGTSGSWVSTDPLFVIGNGASAGSPANALTVLKNGGVNMSTLSGTGTRMVTTDASGNLNTMASLAGTGTRMVTADASGNLSTQALPGGSQSLSIVGSTISLSGGGGSVIVPSSADNLGNHTATTSLNLNNHLINSIGTSMTFTNSQVISQVGTSNLDINCKLAIGGTPSYELDVFGTTRTSLSYITSDKRFKKNITNLNSTLQKVLRLKMYTYLYNQQEFPRMRFNDKLHYGVLAQELKEIFPNLVSEDKDGYYSVNYIEMIPLVITAMKEQQEMIDSLKTDKVSLENYINQQEAINVALKKQMDQLATIVNGCCTNNTMKPDVNNTSSQSNPNYTNVELSDKNSIVIDQNIPNPFSEETTIHYYLPDNITRAQIIFFAQSGKIIKTVDLTEKGKGKLRVFADDLSNGIYTYSLIIDGQTIETKKMIKTK